MTNTPNTFPPYANLTLTADELAILYTALSRLSPNTGPETRHDVKRLMNHVETVYAALIADEEAAADTEAAS
jgi:hypothetical protein